MSRLDVLARLAKLKVDEARVKLARLEGERDQWRAAIVGLDEAVAAERLAAAQSLEARSTFAAYVTAAQVRRESLTTMAESASAAVETQHGVLRACFRELKTYDLAIEAEDAREREVERRKESATLDEIAADRARRRAGESGPV
jgi:flagellar export protein FliJ